MNRPRQIKQAELEDALRLLDAQGIEIRWQGLNGDVPVPAEVVAESVFDLVEYARRRKVGLTV